METQCIADFPPSNMDEPPRKRPRLTWDVLPPLPPSLPTKVKWLKRQSKWFSTVLHDLRLIDADLKPENILLVSSECIRVPDYKFVSGSSKDGAYYKSLPKSSSIKLIDFGSTTEALFQTHENLEHLAMMERVLGPLPKHMVHRADRRAEKHFKRGMRLDWPDGATLRESMKAVWKLPRLQNLVMQLVDHSSGDLIDLLQGLLEYDPDERLKAREELRHPFFT